MRNANPARGPPQNSLRARRDIPPWLAPRLRTPSAPACSPLRAPCRRAPDPPLAPQDGSAAPLPSRPPSARASRAPGSTPRYASTTSYFLRPRAQNPFNHFGHAVPFFSFRLQPALSRRCQVVILRFPLVVRLAPFAPDPALILQPVQRRIKRALLNLQPILRYLLDAQQNSVPVQWSERNGL